MTWQNRIQPAVYFAPDRKEYRFDFETVERVTEKRTSAFTFPGVNESYVQDNGYGSRKYAMRCFFNGDDCDRNATAFEGALLAEGVGKLQHPLYGTFNVVPFGTISRRDDLKRAANQAVVEVTFWTTTGVVYPTSEPSPKNEVVGAIDDYSVVQAEAYGDNMALDTPTQYSQVKGTIQKQIALIDKALRIQAEANEEIAREFNDWQLIINESISVLVGQPVLLAQQVNNLILAPARAVTGIENRITGYANFVRSVFQSEIGQPWLQPCACANPRRQVSIGNDWETAVQQATSAFVAMALSAVEHTFRTKPEALSMADYLLTEFDVLVAWIEQGYAAFADALGRRIEVIDDGRSYREAQRVVALCAGYLVQISFTLAAERRIVLDRPRTIVDLAAELYGSIDDQLDFLISSNDLSGSEILELPRDKEIVYYP